MCLKCQWAGTNIGEQIGCLHPTINLSSPITSLDVGKWCSIKGKTTWGSSLGHSTVGYYNCGRRYSIYIISGLSREFNQLVYVLVSGKMVSIILCSCFIFTTIPSQYYILWLFVTVQILNIAVLLT